MNKDSRNFWIIPIVFLAIGFIIMAFVIDHKINTIYPNAAIELDEIKAMSCDEVNARDSLGSYWTPANGKFARDQIKSCVAAKTAYLDNLREVLYNGTHQGKIDAGFTKLWFGVYDHPDLSFKPKSSIVKIVHTSIHGISEFSPANITVIIGYNSTIKFENESDDTFIIQENNGQFITPQIQNQTSSNITLNDPGYYKYFAKPWMTGTITVLEQ